MLNLQRAMTSGAIGGFTTTPTPSIKGGKWILWLE